MALKKKVGPNATEVFAFGLKDKAGVASILSTGAPAHEHFLFVTSFKRANVDAIIGGMSCVNGFAMPYDAGKTLTVHIRNTGPVEADVTVVTTT